MPPTPPADLPLSLLQTRFRHSAFRPGQREVCEALWRGEDALLVMPTGGGKSLCYQLPGLLRERPTLVISPLIALMDDQVAKLQENGLRAERIHSGLGRDHARETARRYRDGELDYLFISPERLKVPGFPEWLSRHKPGLVAVDEAHCISMWGHDFRPEYRLLGERLPIIRGEQGEVPLIAMTATATVRVQKDIIRQLGIADGGRFIRGFARDDLAIEVVDCQQAERTDLVMATLSDETNRPALVYVLSRKKATELAAQLQETGEMHAAAYHAGLDSDRRTAVQTAFLAGDVDVVVATVAFGMGIDKSDVRTVFHVGMPSTIEGYYQEIGRAGRDRTGARAIALFNWGDRRTHEFLMDRSYPPIGELRSMHRRVRDVAQPKSELVRNETHDAALQKLVGFGLVDIDHDDMVRAVQGRSGQWQKDYQEQRDWRVKQLDDAFGYVGASGCRMAALVRYFGDAKGRGLRCGMCDHCAPDTCSIRQFEPPDASDRQMMQDIVSTLGQRESLSAGKLFRDHVGGNPQRRNTFDNVLAALERAGIVRGWMDSFENGGKTISYRRVALDQGDWMHDPNWTQTVELDTRSKAATARKARKSRPKAISAELDAGAADDAVIEALRAWRLGTARSQGVPAFVVLSDKTLLQLAAAMPGTREELLAVHGIGPGKADKYGDELLAELRS